MFFNTIFKGLLKLYFQVLTQPKNNIKLNKTIQGNIGLYTEGMICRTLSMYTNN